MINYTKLYKLASSFFKLADNDIPPYYVDSLDVQESFNPEDKHIGTAADSKGLFYDIFETKRYHHYRVLNKTYTSHGTQEGKL